MKKLILFILVAALVLFGTSFALQGAAAKKAGRVILGENDSVTLNEYFNGIGGADSHLCSHFLGYYYAPKLVHVSYDSCRFH